MLCMCFHCFILFLFSSLVLSSFDTFRALFLFFLKSGRSFRFVPSDDVVRFFFFLFLFKRHIFHEFLFLVVTFTAQIVRRYECIYNVSSSNRYECCIAFHFTCCLPSPHKKVLFFEFGPPLSLSVRPFL